MTEAGKTEKGLSDNGSGAVINLAVSPDKLSASVSVKPGNAAEDIDINHIYSKIHSAGITFGVDDSAISTIVEKFNKEHKSVDFTQVAAGKQGKAGTKGNLTLKISGITKKEDFQKIESLDTPHISEVKAVASGAKTVHAGNRIAEHMPPSPAEKGMNIFGEEIIIKEMSEGESRVSDRVEKKSDDTYVSKITGVPVLIDHYLDVFPVNPDAAAEIKIEERNMKALLDILPAGEGGKDISVHNVELLLQDKNVTSGIDHDAMEKAVESAAENRIPVRETLIASGTPPVQGEDGKIEFFFNAKGQLSPKQNEDGSVDFKQLNLIISVNKGQELARLHPPGEGEPGTDLSGSEIPTLRGKEQKLPMGPNTEQKEDDPNVLIASTDGNVTYNGTIVEVHEGYVVNGDVDFSTGNIDYNKSVTIKNDLKAGFEISSGSDVEVGGLIEDAVIKAKGNVLIKGGFVGTGKGVIDAYGNVNISFAHNQTIKSRGNIIIAREAVNCQLMARDNIQVLGSPLSISGGKASARNQIEVNFAGNESGVRTELSVGIDFTLLEEKYKAETKIKELKESNRKIAENFNKLDKLRKVKKVLPPKQEFLLKKLKSMSVKIENQLKSLGKRLELIEEKINQERKAFIDIKDKAYPGTTFIVGGQHMAVTEEIIGPKKVMLVKSEIKLV
ncbi:MAG: flagellar assembly protein A [Fibrobacterota bacterium]